MSLKTKEAIDKNEEERERRERATKEHFPETKGLSTAWRLAPVVAQAADAATTAVGRNRGLKERNPVMKGLADKPLLMAGAKLAQGALSSYVANKVAKKHKTLGKVIAAGAAAAPAAAATSNTVKILKHKKK